MTEIELKTNFIDNIKGIITKAQENAVRSISGHKATTIANIQCLQYKILPFHC